MKISQEQLMTFSGKVFGSQTDVQKVLDESPFSISFNDVTHTITITIDNVNEQDYGWIKNEIL